MDNVYQFRTREDLYFNQQQEADEAALAQTRQILEMSPKQIETYFRTFGDPVEALSHQWGATNKAFSRMLRTLRSY